MNAPERRDPEAMDIVQPQALTTPAETVACSVIGWDDGT